MAVIYLRSTDGNDADDGSTWALAKATLAAALTAAGAGGTIYVSDNHAETQASAMTLTSPGTAAAPVKVLCADDSAEPPTALATTATVSTTGANNISFVDGHTYCYGITFTAGDGTSNASITTTNTTNTCSLIFKKSALRLGGNNATPRISLGSSNATSDDFLTVLDDTTVQFAHASQAIVPRQRIKWLNTPSAVTGGTLPTTLFIPATFSAAQFVASGVDLSALGSGKNIVNVAGGAPHSFVFSNCKLGSSVTLVTGTNTGIGGTVASFDNCDSVDTNYRMERYTYQGSVKTETSKIHSGGASDGTTAISWNMTSLSGSTFFSPLESPPIAVWNETTGSAITATVEIALDSAGTALKESECWLEVEYLGTSGFPVSSFATDHNSNVLTASTTDQTSSSETWNNMTTPTKQKLAVTFTPQEKGYFFCRVMLAKPSVTVYVDPKITVS